MDLLIGTALRVLPAHLANALFGQYSYYSGARLVNLEPVEGKVLLELSGEMNPDRRSELLDAVKGLPGVMGVASNGRRARFIVQGVHQFTQRTGELEGVEFVSRYLRTEAGEEIAPTNLLLVKLKSVFDYQRMLDVASAQGLGLLRKDRYDDLLFVFKGGSRTADNIVSAAKSLYETGLFEYAEPNFVRTATAYSNDPYYPSQWPLENTGQSGGIVDADIDAPETWQITTGQSDIKIAIVDEGVQLDHPDLIDNLLMGYDASGNGTEGGPVSGPHGTEVAGIVGAMSDNGIGVAGVAPGCSLIPVSLDLSSAGYTDIEGADAINWSWDQGGADVINISWGWQNDPSSLISDAINNAVDYGRGGLGCVVVVAGGNENESSISFPADLPNVIAAGATDMCDRRMLPIPCAGSNVGGGSNYGAALDIVAPGHQTWTTTVGSGYVEFGGTSCAAPHVAGVAALILSVNPCLSHDKVKELLYFSCDKPGANETTCYSTSSAYPYGPWDNEMGYGRVNALNAVRAAFLDPLDPHWLEPGSAVLGPYDCPGSWGGYCALEVISDPCGSTVAAGFYPTYYYRVEKYITYPYRANPQVLAHATGLSSASPNNGSHWCGVSNITPTSATLYTYAYYAYTVGGSEVGWIGNSPSAVRFNYVVLGHIREQEELQNETVLDDNRSVRASNWILCGKEVTTEVPFGPYNVLGESHVDLYASKSIRFEPGCEFVPSGDGYISARVGTFATCTQYPEGLRFFNGGVAIEPMREGVIDLGLGGEEGLVIAPNPVMGNTRLRLTLERDEDVSIFVLDGHGRYVTTVLDRHFIAGMNELVFEPSGVGPGVYLCIARTLSGRTFVDRFVVLE